MTRTPPTCIKEVSVYEDVTKNICYYRTNPKLYFYTEINIYDINIRQDKTGNIQNNGYLPLQNILISFTVSIY
jgi:hypothetical protein